MGLSLHANPLTLYKINGVTHTPAKKTADGFRTAADCVAPGGNPNPLLCPRLPATIRDQVSTQLMIWKSELNTEILLDEFSLPGLMEKSVNRIPWISLALASHSSQRQ